MALDSRQKRAAVIGVGRPWYRNADPNGLDAAQRAAIGNVYPVAAFSPPVTPEGSPVQQLNIHIALSI